MADRFSGSIYVGGRITEKMFSDLEDLLNPLLEGELDYDGYGCFYDCTSSDFDEVIKHCNDNQIALMIQWDAKYEYDAYVTYYMNGKESSYRSNNGGDILVAVSDLEEHPCMFICDYIKKLEIPNFPNLEIIDAAVQD